MSCQLILRSKNKTKLGKWNKSLMCGMKKVDNCHIVVNFEQDFDTFSGFLSLKQGPISRLSKYVN